MLANYCLFQGMRLSQAQKIIVKSFIRFDINYVFAANSEIILLPGAQIFVDARLNMDDVTIKGCDGAWLNIDVSSTGLLIISNSDISNSCEGIILRSGARASITDNIFTNNYTCIQATGNVVLFGEGIAHNTFDGTLNTYTNCSPANPIAIRLYNMRYIRIGDQAQVGLSNTIKGYYQGIRATNTNVDIVNTTFSQGAPSWTAVFLTSNTGIYTANIIGRGKYATSPTFVQDYDVAIFSENYNLTVKNARFRTSSNTIQISAGTLPTKIDIHENRFENYVTNAIFTQNCTFSKLNIKNNDFFDENPAEGEYSSAIRWNNNYLTSDLVKPNIELNYFYDNVKPGSNPFSLKYQTYEVWATNPKNLVIHDNNFIQNYQSSIPHEFKGVYLTGKDHNEISNNTFSTSFGAMSSNSFNWGYRGIDIDNSSNNLISCNYFTGFNHGSYYTGNCDHADIKNNITSSNIRGLYLFPGSVVGQQFEKQNLWPGNLANDVAEAQFDGNPAQGALTSSQFKVNSSDLSSDYWPTPVLPNTGWFIPSGNEPGPQTGCVISAAAAKSERERQAITGEFQAYKGYPASTWEARLNAFGTLAAHSESLINGSADAQFYNANTSGNIGNLYRAQQSWDAIMQFNTSFESSWTSNQTAIAQKLSDIAAQTDLMENTITEADQLQIAQTIASLQTDLEALQSTNQSYSTQYRSDVTSRANTLLSDLGQISTTDVWETNLKTVLTLSVQRLLSSSEPWSSTQLSTLQAVADQCRHAGGAGVVLARTAIGAFNYNDEAMCPGENYASGQGSDRSNTAIQLQAMLTPNPATDLCRISFERPVSGSLFVQNGQGQVVQTLQIKEENSLDLDTRKLATGLYTIRIKDAQGGQFVNKLSVIH